jgi:glutamate formiminotransferase/formiminotetrahydrofolate cyclodeaminase
VKPLVECVPNFSEGRDQEKIDAIVDAMRAVERVHILDVESDADHNRSVVTMVGPPDAVQEAAFQGIARAAELINLAEHEGEHPRIGATDVVPFVPIAGVLTQECVALAHDLGQRVGDELGIPVYFYEEAALRPDRVDLGHIRSGEYEALKEEIGTNPDREPDAGPAEIGPAGATVIGARQYLIAFNAYLDTDDVSIANRIARAIRHVSGGYRYVKAMGVMVAGQAQVSMNLTHYRKTPIYRVVEAIRREAARYGTRVTHTELVGLVPEEALIDAAQWHLQLDIFDPDQILEHKLRALDEGAPLGFLDALASKAPTPGGGSAAALAGAMSAALGAMVGRLTAGRSRFADVRDEVRELIIEAEKLRQALTEGMEEDAEAFNAVMAAYKLPKGTEKEQAKRHAATQRAMTHAAEVPLETAREVLRAMEIALTMTQKGNPNAVTDAASAVWLGMAALQSAALNVRINATSIDDQERARGWLDELDGLLTRADAILAQAQATAVERGGL